MIGCHEGHRGPGQNPGTIELPPIEHGLTVTEVIARCTHTASPARIVARHLADIDQLVIHPARGVFRKWLSKTPCLVSWHMKAGIRHLQGRKQPLLHEINQALSGHCLDHTPLHIHGKAVLPGCTRLLRKGRLAQLLGHRRARELARIVIKIRFVDVGLDIGISDQGVLGQFAIGNPRRMPQQILNRWFTVSWHQTEAHAMKNRIKRRDADHWTLESR